MVLSSYSVLSANGLSCMVSGYVSTAVAGSFDLSAEKDFRPRQESMPCAHPLPKRISHGVATEAVWGCKVPNRC